mmetsp:Transcript_19375/g.36591  ORF Transcript_19375/g.36591 Transcript_19375/m.36591 type:complete len:138 (+) Transcript_19375:114-527(+)
MPAIFSVGPRRVQAFASFHDFLHHGPAEQDVVVVFSSTMEAARKTPSTSQEDALVRRCDTVFGRGFFCSDVSASCGEMFQNGGLRHRFDGLSSSSIIVEGGSFISVLSDSYLKSSSAHNKARFVWKVDAFGGIRQDP